MDAAVREIEFLARSTHRVEVLYAVAERPHRRDELRELTGASSANLGRVLRSFEKRNWIVRDGHSYEATPLGEFVVGEFRGLHEGMKTERKLRDTWQWLPTEAKRFTIEMVSEAVVTVAETADPYGPVNRFVSLLRETNRFRFVGYNNALLEPCKDELRRRIVDGMQMEVINPPSVARYVLSTYPDHCSASFESGNLTVQVHEDVPSYGISLFDDRIGISGYNPDSGTVQVLVDSDAPEVREWAESAFDSYRRETRPFTPETAA